MPCTYDEVPPTQDQIALSKVLACLKEVKSGKMDLDLWDNGYNPKVYNMGSIEVGAKLKEKTTYLCKTIKALVVNGVKIELYSLELQLWWRDHQKMDKKRIAREEHEKKVAAARAKALSKLTIEERKLLGL